MDNSLNYYLLHISRVLRRKFWLSPGNLSSQCCLDELHARLDDCAERLDSTLADFDSRIMRSLLAASRTSEGGRDGSMFMRSFDSFVDEWSNRKKENERLAKAVVAARPIVDSGIGRARSTAVN